jgi:hypothetical protein
MLAASMLQRADHARVTELLGVAQPADKVQLFPPGKDVLSAHTYLKTLGVDSRQFTRQGLSGGHTLDIYFRPDQTVEYKLEWYDPPSVTAKRLKAATVYGADGKTPLGEAGFREDGSREMRSVRLADGNYETVMYFEDGVSHAFRTLWGKSFEVWDHDQVMLTATKWNRKGAVIYTNSLNKDMSRDVSFLDDDGQPLKVMHIGKWNSDSTIVMYFPGTKQPRIQAKSTYSETQADFFRRDGTKEMHGNFYSSSAYIELFDATGRQELRQLTVSYERVVVNGIGNMSNPHLSGLLIKDDRGTASLEWTWHDAKNVYSYEEYNITVPNPDPKGQPIRCNRVGYYYREDGTLESKTFQPAASDIQFWQVKVPQADNIRAPMPPASWMVMPEIDPDLPIPEPQRGGYG